MAKMKKGTNIGFVDMDYNAVAVGDTLLDIKSNITYVVDEYGRLRSGHTSMLAKLAPWTQLRIVNNVDAQDKEAQRVLEEIEAKAGVQEAVEALDCKGDNAVPDTQSLSSSEAPVKLQEDACSDLSDEQLRDELKRRGYCGRLSKVIELEF